MKAVVTSKQLIGACGLYCAACRKYRRGKCAGCRANETGLKWCGVRKCCADHGYHTCADCPVKAETCKTFNSPMSRLIGFLLNSDRAACIRYIRRHGEQAFAEQMAWYEQQTMRRR